MSLVVLTVFRSVLTGCLLRGQRELARILIVILFERRPVLTVTGPRVPLPMLQKLEVKSPMQTWFNMLLLFLSKAVISVCLPVFAETPVWCGLFCRMCNWSTWQVCHESAEWKWRIWPYLGQQNFHLIGASEHLYALKVPSLYNLLTPAVFKEAWESMESQTPSCELVGEGGEDMIGFVWRLHGWDGVLPLELPLVGPVEADQVHVLVTGSVYLAGDVLSVSFW